MSTGDRPSLKSEEGRFEYLRGELKVIRTQGEQTTEAIRRLDAGKVDKSACQLQEQEVQVKLEEIKGCVRQMTAQIEETVNGALADKVGSLVNAEMEEQSANAELELLRARSKPILAKVKDKAVAISAVLALLATLSGGVYAAGNYVMGWLADKMSRAEASQRAVRDDLRHLRRGPVVIPVPVVVQPDASTSRRQRHRRRPLTRRRVAP